MEHGYGSIKICVELPSPSFQFVYRGGSSDIRGKTEAPSDFIKFNSDHTEIPSWTTGIPKEFV